MSHSLQNIGGPSARLTCPHCGATSEHYWPGVDALPGVVHEPECQDYGKDLPDPFVGPGSECPGEDENDEG